MQSLLIVFGMGLLAFLAVQAALAACTMVRWLLARWLPVLCNVAAFGVIILIVQFVSEAKP